MKGVLLWGHSTTTESVGQETRKTRNNWVLVTKAAWKLIVSRYLIFLKTLSVF